MREAFSLSSLAFSLCRSRNLKEDLPSTKSKTISSIGLKHGDMLFLIPHEGSDLWHANNQVDVPINTPGTSSSSTSDNTPSGMDQF